jgi:hypothetical protein
VRSQGETEVASSACYIQHSAAIIQLLKSFHQPTSENLGSLIGALLASFLLSGRFCNLLLFVGHTSPMLLSCLQHLIDSPIAHFLYVQSANLCKLYTRRAGL